MRGVPALKGRATDVAYRARRLNMMRSVGGTLLLALQVVADDRLHLPGPAWTVTSPSLVAATGAALVGTLLLVLYVYRRRGFILQWTVSWLALSASLLIAGATFGSPALARMMLGLSQFLSIAAGLLLILAADSYRQPTGVPRRAFIGMIAVLIWFALSPIVLGPRAAVVPGYLMSAGVLGTAAIAYLKLLHGVRLLGAGLIGVMLLLLCGSHAYLALMIARADTVQQIPLVILTLNAMVYLFAALGMHLMVFEDMTYELRRTNRTLAAAQDELRHLVITDALTGCHNRRFFDEVIGRELQRHRRYRIPLSLLFIDVDRFKVVNDSLGHEAGDRVLQLVAQVLRRQVREADYVFRWGGDEFLVLISCGEREASRKALQLKGAFRAHPDVASLPPGVGLSIGCLEVPPDTTDVAALLHEADERMYRDKGAAI